MRRHACASPCWVVRQQGSLHLSRPGDITVGGREPSPQCTAGAASSDVPVVARWSRLRMPVKEV